MASVTRSVSKTRAWWRQDAGAGRAYERMGAHTLFDIYNFDDTIHLWFIDGEGRRVHLRDVFHPVIYADGPPALLRRFVDRLRELQALAREPHWTIRRHFYENRPKRVLEIRIARPSLLPTIRKKLYAFYGRMDIYHSDIELPTAYMYARGIFPTARVLAQANGSGWVQDIRLAPEEQDGEALDYSLPPLRFLRIALLRGHRLGLTVRNPLVVRTETEEHVLAERSFAKLIGRLNELLDSTDPDVVLTTHGDQTFLPTLFGAAQERGLTLHLDRDRSPPTSRKIVRKGSSFNTYGSWIYRAPSYPLFGRWHIDSANSFVYKEAELAGIIELARISRMPVQRLARASTGGALTNIETQVAIRRNYLVPWQKSAVESPKTAYELLQVDKGGLIFVPNAREGNVYEDVVQIDYSQMYPSIMVNHNISPETINCPCCHSEDVPRVPETGYRICMSRTGVVSEALRRVLERRHYFKRRKQETTGELRELYDARQNSLKWMLVTSFGYLGFRNAKFGRIESHESVTAFGREKLLVAKELAEAAHFELLHAITDSLFIRPEVGRANSSESADRLDDWLAALCDSIGRAVGVEMSIEGVYSWVVFLPSRNDAELPVVNRYFGRFRDGSLKYRGIAVRRRDVPPFISEAQLELLEWMGSFARVSDLRARHDEAVALYEARDALLRDGPVNWRDLLFRRTVGKAREDYTVAGATALSLDQLAEYGMEVQPGEKVRFLALQVGSPDARRRYLSEERAELTYRDGGAPYDALYYRRQLWEAFREVWEYFAPEAWFSRKFDLQMKLW